MKGTLRTLETQEKYEEYKKVGGLDSECVLCEIPAIEEFKYWKIAMNRFPYDKVADPHHMMIIKRHVPANEITGEEWMEYNALKQSGEYIDKNYDFIFESTVKMMTVPQHLHLHLIVVK